MKKIVSCFILFISFPLNSQTWQWALGSNENGVGAFGRAVDTDAKGNVYLAASGGFTSNCSVPSAMGTLSKFDSNGNLIWTRTMGAQIEALSVDDKGNCYLTGGHHGQGSYFCGGSNNSLTLTAKGQLDVFLVKYDYNGNIKWAKSYGDSISTDIGRAVKVDPFGNVLITGNYVYVDNTVIHNNDFIWKFDSLGNQIWNTNSNYKGLVFPSSLDVDASGASYVTGMFSDSAFFGTHILTQPFATDNIYLVKYNASGIVVWAKKIGDNPSKANESYGLVLDQNGHFYITGKFRGSTVFDTFTITTTANSGAMFIAKYDTSGTALWVRNTNIGWGLGVAIDAAKNCIVTGSFRSTVYFTSPSNTISLLSSRTVDDIFIAKYSSNGTFLSAMKPGGSGGSSAIGRSITFDNKNNFYLTGYTTENTIFGNHNLYQPVSLKGSNDVFIAKYGEKDSLNGSDVSIYSSFSSNLHVSAYPNPARENIKVQMNNPFQFKIAVELLSVNGQILYKDESSTLTDYSEDIRIEDLANGIYFLKVHVNEECIVKKISVQHN